jgi:hypothetical protein
MSLAIESVPDDPGRLLGWLEARMAGGELRALVAELAALHNVVRPQDSIRDRFGPADLEAILRNGLGALAPAKSRELAQHLLRQPHHLLELQALVLAEGGPYWDALPQPTELLDQVAQGRELLARKFVAMLADTSRTRPGEGKAKWYRSTWFTIATTAALVFITTFAVMRIFPPAPPVPGPNASVAQWGWAKPGGIPMESDRSKYLAALADRADEWFDERPADAPAMTRRLAEFHQGCSAFLFAPHSPLTPELRDELRRKCRDWAQKFEGYLAALEAGHDPVAVRAQADATVRKLADALRAESRKN